jgi:hypothetical protein
MNAKHFVAVSPLVGTLISCGDALDPAESISVTATKDIFGLDDVVSVTITNRSATTLFVRDHSELSPGTSGSGVISVAGCEFQTMIPWWVLLRPGESVTCEHATSPTYPRGEYRLLVVVETDTVWRGALRPSNIFRLGN